MQIIADKHHSKQSPSEGLKKYSPPDLIKGYFACPIDLYQSKEYEVAITTARFQFTSTYFIEPAKKNWCTASWLKAWDRILPDLQILTCVPRRDLSIGRGCHKEVSEAHAAGISIYIFDHDRVRFFPFQKLIRIKFALRSLPYYSRVYSQSSGRAS